MNRWLRACLGLSMALPLLAGGLALSQEPVTCRGRAATITGTAAPDVLRGTEGDDVIAGLDGDDTIHASDGNDIICGGESDDDIFGEEGNDVLDLGETSGGDRADGGPGDDFFLPTDSGQNVIEGGPGSADSISFAAFTGDLDGLYIDLRGSFSGREHSRTEGLISGVERAAGGPFDDLIRGTHGADKLVGGPGDDLLDGRGGPDVLRGRRGRDKAIGGRGRDRCQAEVRRSCEKIF